MIEALDKWHWMYYIIYKKRKGENKMQKFFEIWDEYCYLMDPSNQAGEDEFDRIEHEICSDYAYEKRMDRLTWE